MKNQTNLDNNAFPPLVLKDEYKATENETRAYAYRLAKDAKIYDAIDGVVVTQWEARTSFTSNKRTKEWIKITGYFVDKVWRPSTKEMWIKSSDTIKRDR